MLIYLTEKWDRSDICFLCGNPTGFSRDEDKGNYDYHRYFDIGKYAYCQSCVKTHIFSNESIKQVERVTGLKRK